MQVDTFIRRWEASTRNQAAAAKPHFLDLCALLGFPTPTDSDYYASHQAILEKPERMRCHTYERSRRR
jgi:hypothetical protein